MDDRQIIGLFLMRSEQAILETQQKYGAYVRRIVENILGAPEDCEECLNDICWTLWKKIPPEEPQSLKDFLGTVARNAAISRYRAARAEKRGGGAVLPLSELENCVDARTIDDELQARRPTELLNCFLAGLPKKARVIFVKRYWYLSSVERIALETDSTERTVKMSLHRTRKKLRAYLPEVEKEVFLNNLVLAL